MLRKRKYHAKCFICINADSRSAIESFDRDGSGGSPRKSNCHRLSAVNHHPDKKLIKISGKKTPTVHIKSFNLVRGIAAADMMSIITIGTQNGSWWLAALLLLFWWNTWSYIKEWAREESESKSQNCVFAAFTLRTITLKKIINK